MMACDELFPIAPEADVFAVIPLCAHGACHVWGRWAELHGESRRRPWGHIIPSSRL